MLSEISQMERDKWHVIDSTYTWNLKTSKQTNKQNPNSQIQNRLAAARNKGLGWAGCVKVGTRSKLPIIKEVSPGDVTCIMMTIINSTILHI